MKPSPLADPGCDAAAPTAAPISTGTNPASPARLASARWALMVGNFAIGCGVMVVPGSLNDLTASLQVSVAVAGQLVSVAAVTMGVAAPLMAALMGAIDRRRLLTLALLWYAAGHLLAVVMPGFAALLPVRAATMLAAAVFTPQAGAAINLLAPPGERGRAITFIFLGWSLASVLGMPVHSYIGETFGWRWAFALVAVLSLAAAAAVWRTLPDGLRPPAMSLAGWGRVLGNPMLMGLVAVTVLSACGQFTLFSYFAPYFRQVLGATAAQVSLLFLCFGAFGLLGNLLLTRWIDRVGAATSVTFTLVLIALSLLAWPLAVGVAGMALVLVPWALGCFASNSAQQARLSISAPGFTAALLALNTSAMYLGQAVGAASGGATLTARGYEALPVAGLVWMLLATAASALLGWRMRGRVEHG